MAKPIAVFVGFIGKLPLAGMALANLHMISGLQKLGYDVHYVEQQNKPDDCYDPAANTMTNDPSCALRFIDSLLPRYGISKERYSLIDMEHRCHGSGWPTLRNSLDHADFVLTLGDPAWFDELERCPHRAFLDADPMFTQVAMLSETSVESAATAHYDVLFTYGVRMGQPDCPIPSASRTWLPARMAVETDWWTPTPAAKDLPVTTLMNWSSGRDIEYEGRTYGYKAREFERFIELPRRAPYRFELAVGGSAPRDRLEEYGWDLVNPLAATKTIESYQKFIAGSRVDIGIAKHAYVATRSGWFSDRSTCYLAAGRPVLHQDTGCGDWLPTGEGVILFSTVEDVLKGLEEFDRDYERHARAARSIAEKHFGAEMALGQIIDRAGFR